MFYKMVYRHARLYLSMLGMLLILGVSINMSVFANENIANTIVTDASNIKLIDQASGPHIKVNLFADTSNFDSTSTIPLGVLFRPDPQWHTYWINPGDSGEPPKMDWSLSITSYHPDIIDKITNESVEDSPLSVSSELITHSNLNANQSEEKSSANQKITSISEISWPIPKVIPVAHLVNYGYEAENLLTVNATLSRTHITEIIKTHTNQLNEQNHKQSERIKHTLNIVADVSWLVCKEDCIPGWATLTLNIPLDSENIDIADVAKSDMLEINSETSAYDATQFAIAHEIENLAKQAKAESSESQQLDVQMLISNIEYLFAEQKKRLPNKEIKTGLFEVTQNEIVFEVPNIDDSDWYIFPVQGNIINHASSQINVYDETENTLRIVAPLADFFNYKSDTMQLLVSNGEQAFYVNAKQSNAVTALSLSNAESSNIWLYVLMAFAGGLILNLMPCVLPILSIKAMALQNTQTEKKHKLAYLLGVMVCFNAFATLILLLQAGGQKVGWGFHMQEPIVLVLLALLFTFLALILLDVVQFSGRFAGLGQGLVEGQSFGSHFFTGALAVIVASPCTAPFMAAAIGIAMVSEPSITLLIFNALALGFALPLTLLFMSKRVLNWLPKPGGWMLTFKHFMAFPMFATVVWLVWVFAGQLGTQAQFLLMLLLVIFCMFVWLLAQLKSSIGKRVSVLGIMLSLVASLYITTLFEQLGNNSEASSNTELAFTTFSQPRLDELKQAGKVVFVNMTADWCITCKVNEQVALRNSQIKNIIDDPNVVYMVGDWTNKNQEILDYLSEYKRAGVPLYVVYAGNSSKQILPQILTPNMVVEAIEKAKEEL